MGPHYEDGADDTYASVEFQEPEMEETTAPEGESTEADMAETREPRRANPHVKTVSVQYGRKLNLGDYNSAEISVTLWADLDEDEDVQGSLDMLYTQAKENVKKQAMPLLKSEPISLNYRETFLGSQVDAQPKSKER
jgi:hypothetical protein